MKVLATLFLIAILYPVNLHSQEILTSDIIFLTYFKTKNKGIKKKDLTPFLERYHKQEYEQKSADKATMNAYVDEKLEYYNAQLENIKYGTEYITTTYVSLKEYDKEKQAFNLELEHYFSRGTINADERWSGKLDYVGSASNFENYTMLKMDCDDLIDIFINRGSDIRKDSIPVTISLSFYGAVNDEINQFGSSVLFIGYVICKINKLTYHFSESLDFEYKE